MQKKSGTAGDPLDPVAPVEAHEADNADPGKAAEVKAQQRQTQTGKYGSEKNQPFKPDEDKQEEDSKKDDQEEKKKSWIEVELVGEDGKPIPGERYKITLPDGKVAAGTLDQNGSVRVEGFDPGQCTVTFPDLDKEAWDQR